MKFIMKSLIKLLTFILIFCLIVFSLSACGNNTPETEPEVITCTFESIGKEYSDSVLSFEYSGNVNPDINQYTAAIYDAKIWNAMLRQDGQLTLYKDFLQDVESIKAENKEAVKAKSVLDIFAHEFDTTNLSFEGNEEYINDAVKFFKAVDAMSIEISGYANFGDLYPDDYTADSVVQSVEKALEARNNLINSRLVYLSSCGIDIKSYDEQFNYSQGNLSEDEFLNEVLVNHRTWIRAEDNTRLSKCNIMFNSDGNNLFAKLAFLTDYFNYSNSQNYKVGQMIISDMKYIGNSEFTCRFETFDENGEAVYEDAYGNIDVESGILTIFTNSEEAGLQQEYHW